MKTLKCIILAVSLSGCASDGSFDAAAALIVLGAAAQGYSDGLSQQPVQTCTTYPAIGPYGIETTRCY